MFIQAHDDFFPEGFLLWAVRGGEADVEIVFRVLFLGLNL